MKKSIKLLSILMIVTMVAMTATPVLATIDPDAAIGSITPEAPSNTKSILNLVNTILGFIQWGAIIGGTLIIAILGFKYMMGSLQEKAEYKKSMIPLVVGVIVVMGATTIAKLLFSTFVIK